MKKFIFVLVSILWAAWCTNTTLADNSFTAAYSFAISTPTMTTLTVSYSDSNAVAADSLLVIDAADSTAIGYVTTSPTTFTGLSPHTMYDWLIRSVRNDSVHVSNLDSLYTFYPQVEKWSSVSEFEELWGARSYYATGVTFDSLYIDATGADSTMIYWLKGFDDVSIQIKHIGEADSTSAIYYVFTGYTRPSLAVRYDVTNDDPDAIWAFNFAATDSFPFTQNNWSVPKILTLPTGAPHMYIRGDGQAANSNDTVTKALIRLYRSKD